MDRRSFLAQAGGTALLSCVPDWLDLPVEADATKSAVIEEGAAKVLWKSGAGPGQTAVLAGFRLEHASISLARMPDRTQPGPPAEESIAPFAGVEWQAAESLGGAQNYTYVHIPKTWKHGQFAVRIQSDDGQKIDLLLNRPEVWWYLGETERTAIPGHEFRIFGQFLELEETLPQVWIRDADRKWTPAEVVKASPYSISAKLRADIAVGSATVHVHTGFGGAAGWSDPFKIDIQLPVAWPSKVFRVTDFGAVGDSNRDDTAAFHAALVAAAKEGGGVVFVPRGIYRITEQLTIPRMTILRGELREAATLMVPQGASGIKTLIGGSGAFGIEELTIVAQTPGAIVVAPDIVPAYSYSGEGVREIDRAADVRLRRLRIHHLHFAHRVEGADKDPRRSEVEGPPTIILVGARHSVEDCVVVSSGKPIFLQDLVHSRITGNEFRIGRNGWWAFWGGTETLFEGNIIEGQDLEASGGGFATYGRGNGPEVARLFIAENHFLNSYGGEREAMTFDYSAGAFPWKGKLSSGSANSVEICCDLPLPVEKWIGLAGLVTGGKGLGQFRKILSIKGRALVVDGEWEVIPDGTSTIAIVPNKRDVVIYRNHSQDNSVAVQLWAGGYNFIIDGNKTTRSGGFWGRAGEYVENGSAGECFFPLYFTQWLGNESNEGLAYEQGPDFTNGAVCGLYIEGINEAPDGGVLTFANVIRGNRLHDRSKIVLGYYPDQANLQTLEAVRQKRNNPWSLATVVEGNTISDGPVGIAVYAGFEGVLLRENEFIRVKEQVHSVDWKSLSVEVPMYVGSRPV